MNFLILTQYFPPEVGAPQIRLLALGRELVRRGHRVTVVTAMPNYPAGKIFPEYRGRWFVREEMEGISVLRVRMYAASGRGMARLLSYLSFAVLAFWGVLRSEKADVVFTESPPLFLGLTGWLGALWHRSRFVLNISDLWPDSVETLGVMSARVLRPMFALEHFLYRRASLVCGTTRGIVRRLQEVKGLPGSKVVHLPNGADLNLLSPRPKDEALVRQLGIRRDAKVFIYAGTHGYAQRLDTLIDVATAVDREDIHFLFVGDGPEKASLEALVRERGLENVTFVPAQPLSAMPRYFSLAAGSVVTLMKADLFVDALPSKLIASLSCGVAPIYAGAGEAADLLLKNQCGVVVDPEDSSALRSAIERLADDDLTRSRLADNARSLAEREFAWDMIIDKWLSQVLPLMS
jgi:glycosyltransferase involved in cell wall biosynthesis